MNIFEKISNEDLQEYDAPADKAEAIELLDALYIMPSTWQGIRTAVRDLIEQWDNELFDRAEDLVSWEQSLRMGANTHCYW